MKQVSIFFILFVGLLRSQTGIEPYSDGKVNKVIRAEYIKNAPQIDGYIVESVWEQANPIADFIQEEPENGLGPSQSTEVRVLFNNDYLFIAASLEDEEPHKIQGQLGLKDDWEGCFEEQSDWFSIDIDSRHDHQTAFTFSINSSGILADASVSDDSIYDLDWDAIWQAEVTTSEKGWHLEVAIPFSMLRFNEPKDNKMRWGINFTRYIHRSNEYINWVVFPLELHGIVSKYGHLDGLQGIYPPAKLQVTPYFTTKRLSRRDVELYHTEVDSVGQEYGEPWVFNEVGVLEEGSCYDLCNPYKHQDNFLDQYGTHFGFDIKYRISNNSIFDFSFNPDFAQVELDPSEVNLTVYETKLDEKRAFFKENTNFFQTPIEVFYSRRIGQESWVQNARNGVNYWELVPSMIKGASKLTGKTKFGLSYGILSATTTLDRNNLSLIEKLKSNDNKNYNLFRFTQDLLSGNSYIGVILSNFQANSYQKSFASFDYRLNFLEKKFRIEGQSICELIDGDGRAEAGCAPSSGNIFQVDANFGEFSLEYLLEDYDKNFNINDMGYLWRDDFSSYQAKLSYNKRNNKQSFFSLPIPYIKRYSISFTINKSKNQSDVLIDNSQVLNAMFVFKNYWKFWVQSSIYGEHYDDRLIVYDYENNIFGDPVEIQELEGYSFGISTSQLNPVVLKYSRQFIKNSINDLMTKNQYFLYINPLSSFRMELSYENNRLVKSENFVEVVEGDAIDQTIFSRLSSRIDVVTFRSSYTITKNLVFDFYAEYFKNYDKYENYYDYKFNVPISQDYYYSIDEDLSSYDQLLDPNIYPYFFSKLSSMKLNLRLKWEFSRGANIYFVLTSTKEVNGDQSLTFNRLISYDEISTSWTEKYGNLQLLFKLNYWLNL